MISRRNLAKLAGGAAVTGLGSQLPAVAAAAPGGPDAPGTIHLPARDIPVPAYLSPPAKASLAAPRPPAMPAPPASDLAAWRKLTAAMGQAQLGFVRQMAAQAKGSSQEILIEGVRVYDIQPETLTARAGTVYLDIHGGGLTGGGGELCRLLGMSTARSAGMHVWAPDYRMPPDHPYPAALDDCMAVYRALLSKYRPQDIIVGGASAGGNLAAALMLRARDEKLPLPAALVLISPELDLTESGDSFQINMGLDVLSSLMQANLLYAAGQDLSHPYLSPVLGDVRGLPPTILTVGSREIFLSNAVRMHRALRNAGVYAELHVLDAGTHGHLGGASPEDQSISRDMTRFIRTALTAPAQRGRAFELGA